MRKNVLEGTKKIYYSVLCSLGTLAISIITIIIGAFATEDSKTALLFLGLLSGLTLIIALTGFILQIIGCSECGKEQKMFTYALYAAIAAIVFTALAAIIKVTFIKNLFDLLGDISSLLITLLIIRGLMLLFADLNDIEMVNKGRSVLLIFIIAYAASAVIDFVGGILPLMHITGTAILVLGLIAALIAIVAALFYFIYLKQAINHLEFSSFDAVNNNTIIDAEAKEVDRTDE